MSRNIKWTLGIVTGISEYLVYAEAKYCAFEIHGESKYYMCPGTEYCCNFGCCVSPGFQIYHLWYYWLLVIIMFLVCSGGGWWYRYWLQGRYTAAVSSIPIRSSNTRAQNTLRSSTCQPQQARISYNTARNTVLLHRMWKGPHRNITAPTYNGATPTSSAIHYQNTNVVLNDANCPYYQLYGPPPSYETVIAQTQSKFSSPSSPNLCQPNQNSQLSVTTSNNSTSYVTQCFYTVPGKLEPELKVPHYDAPRQENFNSAEYVKLVPQYESTQGNGALHFLRGFCYERNSTTDPGKSLDICNAEENTTAEYESATMDYLNNSCSLDRSLQCHTSSGMFISKVGVHGILRREHVKFDSSNSSLSDLASEPVPTTSSTFASDSYSSSSSRLSNRFESRKIQGGSLKIIRRRGQQVKYREPFKISQRLSSTDYESPSTSRKNDGELLHFESQLNPSNNMILAVDSDVDFDVSKQRYEYCHRHSQQHQHSVVFPIAEQNSTNYNFESKRKLERSKSLD